MVINTDIVKGTLISHLKTVTSVTDELASASEIREVNWKGTTFEYPNIRLRIIRNIPQEGECAVDLSAGWLVFTQDQSSAKCDEISGIIATYFKGKQFSVTFQGNVYHLSLGRVTIIPAVSVGVLAWRSEVVIEGYLSLM